MLAHGFTVAFLAGLVRDRYATAELNSANVVWVEITDLGGRCSPLYRGDRPDKIGVALSDDLASVALRLTTPLRKLGTAAKLGHSSPACTGLVGASCCAELPE